MNKLRAFLLRLRSVFRKERLDRELQEELNAHLELHIADNLRAGMTPAEARRQALLKLGGLEQTKESVRDARSFPFLETLLQDLRFALHLLRKSPAFTAVAILTLALGIGANTAIFSVVYSVLLRPLPYPNPDQIVQLWELNQVGHRVNFAEGNFVDLRATSKDFADLAELGFDDMLVIGGTEPSRVPVSAVSRDFFEVMGVSPVLGRAFTAEDQREGAAPVLLVGHAYWQQNLAASKDLSKFKLIVDSKIFSVVGVMPQGFRFPNDSQLWIPREIYPPDTTSRTAHNWRVFGRLRPGIALPQASAELSTVARRLHQQYAPDIDMSGVAVLSLQDALTAQARPALFLLLGAVGFLLLVACANVANLLMAQSAARGRELAIRAAIGAGRARLVQQFLIESFLLCVTSGTIGVFAARWGVDILLALAPKNLPRLDSVSANLPMFLFALGLSILLASGLGIFTAFRATAGDLRDALGEAGREEFGGLRVQRFGRTLVAGQLSITLLLLVGAGLLGRSLLRVLSLDPGFRTQSVVTMDLSFSPINTDADKLTRVRVMDDMFSRLRNVPGVEAVGGVNQLPLTDDFLPSGTFLILTSRQVPARLEEFDRLFHDPSLTGYADYCVATEDYFRVLGIPLLRGRFFDAGDVLDAPHVTVISDSLARTRWPNEDPLGKTIEFGNMDGDLRLLTIVGIVGDARNRNLETPPTPTVYVDYRQRPHSTDTFTVVMRSALPPATVISAAREVVRNVDPNIPPRFQTFAQVFSTSLATRRFNLTLVLAFAATALFLAAAGIYGVVAYTVSRRTREIGIRMALGATAPDVLRLVLLQGMSAVMIGVALGIAGAFALTRTMQSLLFDVSPTDPATLAGVALLLAAVSLLACFVPARRATRVDPIIALRYE
jgi:putative ABC transport system permease protein